MLKALLKKQFLETASFFFLNAKNGKRRSPRAALGFALLIVYALAAVVFLMWETTGLLCAPLMQSGLGWVYFAFMATLAFSLGCVGSVFAAKSTLFEAKDNEFLLSLPLPTWAILFVRMLSLYLLTFLFEAVVLIPASVRYFVTAGFAVTSAIFQFILLLILPFGTLAVCALLGWLIAYITARIPFKNLLTTALFIGFMVAYFIVVGKINEYLTYIIANGEAVGQTIKTTLFPFWQAGLAALGNPLSLLWTILLFVGVFALVYLLLSATFYRVVTVKRGERKAKYTEKEARKTSVAFALFKRECSHIFKSPMIVLNCALGSVFLLILPVIALFNTDFLNTLASPAYADILALLLCAIVCGISATNTVTSCTVSLEGDTLWLLRSLPVDTKWVFSVKVAFHYAVTAIPATLCAVIVAVLLKLGVWITLLVLLVELAFILLCSVWGLTANLLFPNLHWTNEVAAAKQSVSVLLGMFGGIGAIAFLIGGYFLFGKYLPVAGYLAIALALITLGVVAITVWLIKRGVKIFENF